MNSTAHYTAPGNADYEELNLVIQICKDHDLPFNGDFFIAALHDQRISDEMRNLRITKKRIREQILLFSRRQAADPRKKGIARHDSRK